MSSNTFQNNNNNTNNVTTRRPTRLSKLEQDLKNLQRRMHSPKVDLVERNNNYLVRIELPGVNLDSVKIEVKDSQFVFVSGNKTTAISCETDRVVYRESRYDSFTRRVKLPGKVKPFNFDKENSNFLNGVLNLTFEKESDTEQTNISTNTNETFQNWSDL